MSAPRCPERLGASTGSGRRSERRPRRVLECLEDGSIWIQPFDLQSPRFGLGGTWNRIGPDSATTTITLPDVFVPMRFATGRVWGTVADEFGIQSVAWISLPQGSPH